MDARRLKLEEAKVKFLDAKLAWLQAQAGPNPDRKRLYKEMAEASRELSKQEAAN